ncbi:MAG: AI-2E family transporter [archaeon]
MVRRSFVHEEEFRKYFFWGIAIVLFVLSFFILRSYFVALISAFILAYLVRPLHIRLAPKIGKPASAFSLVTLVVLLVVIPIFFVLRTVLVQVIDYISSGGLRSFWEYVDKFPTIQNSLAHFGLQSGDVALPLLKVLNSAFAYVPSMFLSLFVMLFGMYYILVSWDQLAKNLMSYVPFQNKVAVAKDISRATNTMVYGTFFIGLLEFAVAAIGFYLVGVPFALLWAVLIFFFAFIPALGPIIVWVPAVIYYFAVGEIAMAVWILVIGGGILTLLIDTILRAKVLGDQAKINPLVMLVGILGGVGLFGVFGFIIGPLVLVYTLEIIRAITD